MKLLTLFLILAGMFIHAENVIVLDENFDSAAYVPGAIESATGEPGMEIVTSPVLSAPHALKVGRSKGLAVLDFRFPKNVQDRRNYGISFGVMLIGTGRSSLSFCDQQGGCIGNLYIRSESPTLVYNAQKRYVICEGLPAAPANQWLRFEILSDIQGDVYRIAMTDAAGRRYESNMEHPLLSTEPPANIKLSNVLPLGSQAVFDDFRCFYESTPPTIARKDLTAQASLDDPLHRPLLEDNDTTVEVAPETTVTLTFSPGVDIGAVVVESGDEDGARLPAGLKLRALNTLGHWKDLASLSSPPTPSIEFSDFPPLGIVSRLELTVNGETLILLRKLRVLSPPLKSESSLNLAFAQQVAAEYRLAVYDQQYPEQSVADFHLVNRTAIPFEIIVTVADRRSGQEGFPTKKLTLPPGETILSYPLNKLPNGEYLTTVAGTKGGSFRRLLRHATAPNCSAKPKEDMTGSKMFFPDDFYFTQHNGLQFLPVVAERRLAVQGTADDDTVNLQGSALFLDDNGKLRLNGHTYNRLWQNDSRKYFNAVAEDSSLTKWTVTQGTAKIPPNQPNPFDCSLSEAATPDWEPKPGKDGKITYRFYDAVKDGPAKLNQVSLVWVNPGDGSTAIAGGKYEWQVVVPAAFSVWPIWYRSPGEGIIMRRTPIANGYGVCEIEPEDSSSDLNFGQYLSDDGKALFRIRGRHLMRHEPFQIPYDNTPQTYRLCAVWRTFDGINFDRTYVAPPSANKPVGDQHYGGSTFRVSGGAGLRIGVLNRYDALMQKISWELLYTWDGFRWTRFQFAPPFMANGEIGDWFRGGAYQQCRTGVVKDGLIYHMIAWANTDHHFQSEIVTTFSASVNHITGEYMKKYFSPRQLEKWPPFQEHYHGSWEKLAEDTRNSTSATGVMLYREDGWFRAEAGEKEGNFTTVPVTARGILTANADISANGFLELEMLDAEGRVLATKRLSGNGIRMPVFEHLPGGRFILRGRMQNAKLYTLNFDHGVHQ